MSLTVSKTLLMNNGDSINTYWSNTGIVIVTITPNNEKSVSFSMSPDEWDQLMGKDK